MGRMRKASDALRRSHTIKEVALAANVSVATVSRALQLPQVVAEATRQRVYEAISRLGYTPNAQARSLRTARTQLVIALIPDIANPFFSEVLCGMEQVAHAHGYCVLLGDTQNSLAREQVYADMIPARQADGLITLLPHVPRLPPDYRGHFVNACEYVKDKSVTSVYIDNVQAAASAVQHLISLGHRDIALIAGPPGRQISLERQQGFEQALAAAGLPVNPALMASGDFSFESGSRAAETILASGQKFSAIFSSNDEMAIAAMLTLNKHGLRVPEDVSVAGFDDIRLARYCNPPLTTVAQPKHQLGGEAMTLLLEMLNSSGAQPQKRVLPTELIIRQSTAQRRG